ncbi:subtilase family protein [Chitinophaga polysaccharea]|uniref:Subtilase family protein n=1 Tax=Chitinophaga polysaccharea TaxID=1293035 RepID=A0A561PUC5_9BACT|nr:S8/S53 family peptidase [Chitinophaga polysaccharea]TWF41713.1 subtilase family protein [Chitinophaga polysaccharea]
MKTSNWLMTGVMCLALFSCQKNENAQTGVISNEKNPVAAVPRSAINRFIRGKLADSGYFKWEMAGNDIAWSALVQGDSILSVGYQPADFNDLSHNIHAIDLNSTSWKEAKQQVINLIVENEKKGNPALTEKEVVLLSRNKLPSINVKVSRMATLKSLRSSKLVRYAEPIGYGAYMAGKVSDGKVGVESTLLNFGCGSNNAEPGLVAGADYTNITPGAKQSWNYAYHNIPQAWTKSTGSGVKVMIIDTGVSPDQPNLGSLFNQGFSSGRTIQKLVTYPGGTPDDLCGHGTSMAGALAAPRGTSGSAAGIAYNSNLVTVHAAENVVILSQETVTGVTNAYILGGDDPDVKIISMSLGTIIDVSVIIDAIRYAYNKQKLIFCAAGTSNSFFGSFIGVIFPANQPEVYAVTGMKDNLTDRCGNCHVGSKVAFTVVMEKASNSHLALSTAMTGNDPSTVGGSSVATASCAGIAALVWSKYPSYPKDSIVARMIRAASLSQHKSNQFGWGNVDASLAVGQ